MSELTLCNRCSLALMRADAYRHGVEVVLGRDENGWISARYSDQERPLRFFMELTETCAC